jgi:hypothetical protein
MMTFIRMMFASVVAAILLAGCGMDNSNPLLGKWKPKAVDLGHFKMNIPVNEEIDFTPDKEITRIRGVKETFDIKKYTVTATKDGSKVVIHAIYPEIGDTNLTAYVYDHGNKMKLQAGPEDEIFSRA